MNEEVSILTQHSSQQAADVVRNALAVMRKDLPQLTAVFDAFEGLLSEQAALGAEPSAPDASHFSLNPDDYGVPAPVLTKTPLAVSCDYLRTAAHRLIPAMHHGLPGIRPELEVIGKAAQDCREDLRQCAAALPGLSGNLLEKTAAAMKVPSNILGFVITQLVKPLAAGVATSLGPLVKSLSWTNGFCPICGSWPEMGFLEGKEGRRWLRCSFCGCEWRYPRVRCPFCETENHESLEAFFSQDRPAERAELCHECMRYLVSIDYRDCIEPAPRQVAALGLVYLDMLAQERGFAPGAACGWNVTK